MSHVGGESLRLDLGESGYTVGWLVLQESLLKIDGCVEGKQRFS